MMSADTVCERMFHSPSSVALLDAIFDAVRTQLRMVRMTSRHSCMHVVALMISCRLTDRRMFFHT